MIYSRKQKLIDLGAKALADALLNFAVYSDEADNTILEMCDDSDGNIGDVFRYDAKELFVVPASITLDRLHDVIQIVMGWTGSHLHEFTIGKNRYTEYPESEEDGLVCGKYRLGDLIKQNGRIFTYLYDFGDSWEHELVLEESGYFNPELRTELACLEGERACPPEDVGGVQFRKWADQLGRSSKRKNL